MFFKKAKKCANDISYAQRAQFDGDDKILSEISEQFYDEQNKKSANKQNFSNNLEIGAEKIYANFVKPQSKLAKFNKKLDFVTPYSSLKKLGIVLCIIIFIVSIGVFIGDVLFGKRSLEVLRNLQKEKAFLFTEVERLKAENAELQKTYLERRLLDPDLEK